MAPQKRLVLICALFWLLVPGFAAVAALKPPAATTTSVDICPTVEAETVTVLTINYETVTEAEATVMTISYDTVTVTETAYVGDGDTFTITEVIISYEYLTTTETTTAYEPGVTRTITDRTSTVTTTKTVAFTTKTETATETATVTVERLALSTPSPVNVDIVQNCDAFHLVRNARETCDHLADLYNISKDELYAWNRHVDCDNTASLVGSYICVGAPDAAGYANVAQDSLQN